MTYAELSPNEREILRVIHESSDPEKTREMLMDIFARSATGESMESIAESYGVDEAYKVHWEQKADLKQ